MEGGTGHWVYDRGKGRMEGVGEELFVGAELRCQWQV